MGSSDGWDLAGQAGDGAHEEGARAPAPRPPKRTHKPVRARAHARDRTRARTHLLSPSLPPSTLQTRAHEQGRVRETHTLAQEMQNQRVVRGRANAPAQRGNEIGGGGGRVKEKGREGEGGG